jgi:hypothetical protein
VIASAKGFRVDADWERAHMVLARHLPGYSKDVYCHRLAEPYLREALRRALAAAPDYAVYSIGCFCPRHMRHDPKRPLSLHSYGAACDANAPDNKPNTPGNLPPAWVEAWESVGWIWGGRWRWRDAMHFQLARL